MEVRINKKMASKLAACVLCGTLTGVSLIGCSGQDTSVQRDSILHGTILEGACVVTFDNGSKDVAVAVSNCLGGDCHYHSLISGEYFADKGNCIKNEIEGNAVHKYEIDTVESISDYLTVDELSKAIQSGLDNDDIKAIVLRVMESPKEEITPKIK